MWIIYDFVTRIQIAAFPKNTERRKNSKWLRENKDFLYWHEQD